MDKEFRAEMERILVRRILQRFKYPPDDAPEAVELILKQAAVLSNAWVS